MRGPNGRDARLPRREFLRHLLLASVSGLAGIPATRALAAPAAPPHVPGSPPDAQDPAGITVRPDDPAINAGPVEYPGVITPLMGYLSAPASPDVYPGILVLHDLTGMSEHVRDVTRRLSKAGYAALALDLLSRMGGTAKFSDPASASTALSALTPSQHLVDLDRSVGYLEARPVVAKSKIGVLGFGFGGLLSWLLLSQNPDLKAGATFYALPSPALIPRITAAVLAIFGDAEQRNLKEITDFDLAIKQAGIPWTYKVESKAGRGFFDDSRDRYVPDAAKDAWNLTLDWYAKHLGR